MHLNANWINHLKAGKSFRVNTFYVCFFQVKLAVPALFAFIEKSATKEKQLFNDDTAFWLLMTLKKIPVASKKPKLMWVMLPKTIWDWISRSQFVTICHADSYLEIGKMLKREL